MSLFEQMRNNYATKTIGAPVAFGAWVKAACPLTDAQLRMIQRTNGNASDFRRVIRGRTYRIIATGATFVCFMWDPTRTTMKALSGVPVGVGAHATLPNPQNRPEIAAADDLLAYFDTTPCSQASIPVVTAFQNAYNASTLPGKLTIDGQYGGNTQRALQNAMDEAQADAGAGPSQQAPTNCFGMTVPTTPALDVTPSTTPVVVTPPANNTTTTTTTTTTATPWGTIALVAAAVTGVGLVGYSVAKKKGFTLRRHTSRGHATLKHRYA